MDRLEVQKRNTLVATTHRGVVKAISSLVGSIREMLTHTVPFNVGERDVLAHALVTLSLVPAAFSIIDALIGGDLDAYHKAIEQLQQVVRKMQDASKAMLGHLSDKTFDTPLPDAEQVPLDTKIDAPSEALDRRDAQRRAAFLEQVAAAMQQKGGTPSLAAFDPATGKGAVVLEHESDAPFDSMGISKKPKLVS